ncbi:protein PET100 homolog, mitochondrial isoform X2 [Phascolarctos cinereus]|uniref:Protein PET100 homolog, mitochondrial isoform X2 n=1 Tax=Phascolarctos cinereus TaxID=38626 RepID=A0A6P5JVH5_PHACI|nr:protein PET100 homolog, mitochondrial isoform X2 [Phascolarctos cinereus]
MPGLRSSPCHLPSFYPGAIIIDRFHLSVCRVSLGHLPREMTLYLTFPVAMFWVSNQAEYFEEYVIRRKEIFPPEREDQRRELEDFKERMRKQREERLRRTSQQ